MNRLLVAVVVAAAVLVAAPPGAIRTLGVVRDVETIDSELRLLAAVRRSIPEHGASRRVARSTNGSMSG